ncbi:MAG: hypothetical protein KatS3mg076_1182 [Candidatus Binatia bacterium]|nr:MAG: hypothetical protein KatS3mg076_1182 [Candidatus Binatia bacterium]
MQDRLVFVIGAPRSGSTLLARMIGAHSLVFARPEPHLLTPLAHLGYYANVQKAPYDHILSAEALREFVADLPNGEHDYLDACRAYADTLYGRMLSTKPEKKLFLDKTPAYALVLDFVSKLYPAARYVVLTRHPLAVFASYAESFFHGDYEAAQDYNPILRRYVPAIAKFLRERRVPIHHVRYEELVASPERHLEEIFRFLGIPHEPEAVEYGRQKPAAKGLGDPITVDRERRPTTASVEKWVSEVASDPRRLEFTKRLVEELDPDDLAEWGYPLERLWEPLEKAGGRVPTVSRPRWDRYRLQRFLIVKLRERARRHPSFARLLHTVRLGADVLLRE